MLMANVVKRFPWFIHAAINCGQDMMFAIKLFDKLLQKNDSKKSFMTINLSKNTNANVSFHKMSINIRACLNLFFNALER